MRHWRRGGKEDDSEQIADLVKLGASEADARAFVAGGADAGPVVFGVWPANNEALDLFFRLKRCWRLHPFSGKPVGLDRCQIESTFRLLRLPAKKWPALLGKIEVCEATVLEGGG